MPSRESASLPCTCTPGIGSGAPLGARPRRGIWVNLVNGDLQGRWLGALSPTYPGDWLLSPRFLIGAGLFLVGFAVNLHADEVLLRLRRSPRAGDRAPGHRIPRGGLYRWYRERFSDYPPERRALAPFVL